MNNQTESCRVSRRVMQLVALATCGGMAACSDHGQRTEPIGHVSAQLTAPSSSVLNNVAPAELAKMRDYLATVIPAQAVVHTILVNNDTFDCIRADQQLSVRTLLSQGIAVDVHAKPRKGLTISTAPKHPSTQRVGPAATEACPADSVPVRRIPVDELAAYGTLDAYLHRAPPSVGTHEHIELVQDGNIRVRNYGASSVFNIWDPFVESSGDFSNTQMWVQDVNANNRTESVEAGFLRYNGQHMRMFVFSTPDGYTTNCFNNNCEFVQTNTGAWLDVDWGAYSVLNGPQQEAEIDIIKDGVDGDWWVMVEGQWLGYWPQSLFHNPGLLYYAQNYTFGGEVYQYNHPSQHTTTVMGSGQYPSSGFGYAAYQGVLRYVCNIVAGQNPWVFCDASSGAAMAIIVDTPQGNTACYDGAYSHNPDPSWGDTLFFGGPGYNANCLQ